MLEEQGQQEAERCEVVSTSLAKKDGATFIVFALRFPDMSVEDRFIPLQNAHNFCDRIKTHLKEASFVLEKVGCRPHPLRGFVKKVSDQT